MLENTVKHWVSNVLMTRTCRNYSAGTMFSQLAPLSGKDVKEPEQKQVLQLPCSRTWRHFSTWHAFIFIFLILTLLPRKRVHSLSVELLNAFVCICPGSRDLGENRITLKRRIPVHGLHPLVEAKRRVKVPGRRCAKSEFPHRYYKSREERSLCLVQELSLSLLSSLSLFSPVFPQIICAHWSALISIQEKLEARKCCTAFPRLLVRLQERQTRLWCEI